MLKKSSVLIVALLASACATQPPAPVVDGFKRAPQAPQIPDQFKPTFSAQAPYVSGALNPVQKAQQKTAKPAAQQRTYMVQQGDTLSQIAKHFRVSVQSLSETNSILPTSILKPGDVLVVPSQAAQNAEKKLAAQTAKIAPKQLVPQGQQKPATVADKRNDASTGHILYKVKPGENLFRIGLKHKVSPLDIMNMNNMAKPEDLQAGAVIKVPLKREKAALADVQNRNAAKSQGLIWPVQGRVITSFGQKGGGIENTGINIAAAEGTPIIAAASGQVIYASGGLKSYGNLILLRHANGLITAYAHNKQNLVERNQQVQRGQVIAYVGQSGNVGSPQLHFEVRRNARAIDPKKVLPKP